MFLVNCLIENLQQEISGFKQEVPARFADGMIGFCPVFSTKEAAEKFASNGQTVSEVVFLKKAGGAEE